MLPTVIVYVQTARKDFIKARALLDLGSQISIIKSDLVTSLGLKRHYSKIPLVGIDGMRTNGNQIVLFYFRPVNSDHPLLSVTAAVLRKPTSYLSNTLVNTNGYCTISDDDGSFRMSEVDIIFGCDILGKILNGNKIDFGTDGPHGMGTIFDFAVFGPISSEIQFNNNTVLHNYSGMTLIDAVEKFWRSEEPPRMDLRDPADVECEDLFVTTTTRDADGRYIVRLPLIPGHQPLGDSRQTAHNRFMALERKFQRQPEFYRKYTDFMTEYISLGHMTVSSFDLNSDKEYYMLAHHGVFKKSGDTSKIRVVFDGSVPTSTGASLNDCLYTGERLQSDITSIILNFRWPFVVFCTDVKMMFRQTWIHEEDRRYQLIYWRKNPSEPLLVYELTTNTYGLKSSPFVAIRCLHQLARDRQNDMPRAAQLLLRGSYVDDLNGGADSLEEARVLRDELISLMNTAGYELRKWSCNVPALLDDLPSDHMETPRPFDGTDDGPGLIKVLGIHWDPSLDIFTYHVNLISDGPVTRRNILSLVARLYDPIGWICPIIFKIKLLLQSLLSNNKESRQVNWDAPAPSSIVKQWHDIISDLPNLRQVSIPRCLKPGGRARYSLHGFCDGSSLGFAAAVYIRSENADGTAFVRLLIAKSKVAPLKTKQTIPKLELSGAVLLTTLLNHVVSTMEHNTEFEEVVGWCDSTIVLAWLRTAPHKLQVFEGNRVSQIISSKIKINWRHVPGEMNSADVASRGSTAAALLRHELWWEPQWLCQSSDYWPTDCSDFPVDLLPGLRAKAMVANAATTDSSIWDLLDRFSSFDKLINVTAYLLRFKNNCINKSSKVFGNISVSERRNAIMHLIRLVQNDSFNEEIMVLRSGKCIKNSLRRLHLFFDNDNIVRVGGRIGASNLSYNARHPILLPAKSKFTDMLVTHYHTVYCHVGANSLSAILSRNYWIISARRVTRHVTFKCVQCFRSRARPTQPYMSDLPSDRVREVRPFLGVGTDFAGPYYIKSSTLRNSKIQKCYLCIFVCLATKSVHLEIVSDLTVDSFIATFTRFVSRRGLPSLIRSDCGTNFTGTDKYLKELYIFIKGSQSDIERKLTSQNITWLFNAPASPNHGGLFEAAVKSAKTHAKRVLGEARLTFEELTTFFTRVEAVMNSRPLCPLSTDPADLEVLTPGHFLIGQPLVALPEYSFTDTNISRLSRFNQIQKLSQHFWARWRNEYLHTLQQRFKWTSHTAPPKLGELVLIKEDNLSALQWRRGRLVKLLPGKDGVVRVAEVKTQHGVLTRPVSKLCRLPLDCS